LKRREPDVEITAAIRAEEVRFECKPEVHVVGYADAPAVAESVSERENLPDELEPGVTYRNFAICWRAAARLEDPDSRGRMTDTDGSGSQEDQTSSRAGRSSSKRKSSRSLGRDEIRADDPRTWSGRRASTEEL
jgi:hypothetical protein